jgi:hypothetical protein
MKKRWLILIAGLLLVLLASSVGVTRASFVDLETSSGNSFTAWTSTKWTQTSQTDFETGVRNKVDTASSPGNVILGAASYTQGDDGQWGFNDIYWRGQTFTPSISGSVTKIIFKAYGAQQKNYAQFDIYETVEGLPAGSSLCSGSMELSNISTTQPGQWYEVTMSGCPSLSAGTMYALIAHVTGKNNPFVYWNCDTTEPGYAEGYMVESSDSGSTWTKKTGVDYMFKIYVGEDISSGTIASQVLDTGNAGARWDGLFWDAELPDDTNITFEVRASDTEFLKDAATPEWTSVGGSSPVTSGLPSGRYKQWQATLTTSDTSKTPTLHEVRVYYGYCP